jgi:integrase
METQQTEKPRLSYAQFLDQQKAKASQYREGSVRWLIEKFIDERGKPGGREIGVSQLYTLRRIQDAPIALKQYDKLKPIDFIDHCKARKAGGTKPQTIMQDMTFLSGVLKYAFEVWEMSEDGLKAYKRAKPQLVREQLIAKSEPRTRLPEDEELDLLRALFTKQNLRKRNKIDMVEVMEAELKTGRRISEICRIERQHVNVAERTCWVYNLKNSKGKGFHAEFALIEGAWEFFEHRLAVIPNHPEARLFPWNHKSCGARYVMAKNELRKEHPHLFNNLRMHDNRAECFVRLLDKGYSAEQVQKGVSLHKGDGKVLRETYLRIKAADLHRGPAALRAQT